MATDATPLITLGPFLGLDTHSSEEFERPGYGVVASSVDVGRKTGSLMTAKGRTQLATFPMLGAGAQIGSLARFDVGPALTFFIVQSQFPPYITGYWSPQSGATGTLPFINTQWIRSVQFGGALYLDSGHQISYSGGTPPLFSCQWQYPAPAGGYGASLVASSMPLAAATYSYAFVTVLSIPQGAYTIFQQTTPFYLASNASYSTNQYGTVTYQPGTLIADGTKAIQLYGAFYGTTADGIAYHTDVYRMSSNSNVFNYLMTIGNPSDNTIDTFTDQAIAANQQLVINRDPPPTGITDIGPDGNPTYRCNPIESLQDRMWVLAREQNANNYDVPQTQLWYTQVGQGWSFDAALQVELVAQEHTTILGETLRGLPQQGYGDQPTALCRIGSQLLVWGQDSTSILYGTDETNYTVLPLFNNVGCIAPLSPTKMREGIVGWLSALGGMIYNQAQLIDVSTESMKDILDTIPSNHWYAAVGSFRRNTWFLSFPLDNITLVAYFPTVQGGTDFSNPRWTTLPYATNATAFYSSLPRSGGAKVPFEQLVAARYGTQFIDYWNDGDSDLGNPVSLVWTSPLHTGEPSWGQCTYRTIAVVAPAQPSKMTVTIAVDPGYSSSPQAFTTGSIDLSRAPTTKIINIPSGLKGYAAQVTINATNNGLVPVEIWEVVIGGNTERTWVVNA